MAQFFNFQGDYFGITEKEVQKNTELYGYNIYSKSDRKSRSSVLQVILSPSFLLILLTVILSFSAGSWGSGIAALIIDAVYAGLEIFIRLSADSRLEEINASTAVKFRVIRGGKLELVDKENIVPEDIIVVQAGERVPVDAYIQESRDLTANESIFTGSNEPVAKFPGAISKSEFKPTFVYSGTKILTGMAICKVSATGVDTKLYHKKGERNNSHGYYTKMEKTARKLILLCSAIAAALAAVALIIRIVAGSEIIESVIRAATLGLCFIPTGIGTIIRFYYVKGASDMISKSAVVKSLCDIEKLNSLSVLCVEKEGAISKSSVEVRGIYARSEELLYKIAALACDRNTTDEAEHALMVKAAFFDENITDIYEQNRFIERIPENDLMSGALWSVGGERLYCIKGAPEQILPLCRFKSDTLFAVQKKQKEYYSSGCQVLAFACANAEEWDIDSTAGFTYTFIGFAAFSAPLRSSVSAAVKTCRRSGVKVVMLTEENPHVAEATGKMIGLSGKTTTGEEIKAAMKYGGDIKLDADIYAKISPEQKLYVIDKLKKRGEVVAMTGTRTSDAEALELADVGITISQHTTGSTYESSDIIMNDDNFASIADMIASARQIHRNIKRAVGTVIAGYTGLIILTMINLFGNAELMLNPALIALITMILLPSAALCYLENRSDLKQNMPPSKFVTSRKINYRFLGQSVLYGFLCGCVSIISYMFMYNGSNISFARSCAFISYGICTALFSFVRISNKNPLKAAILAGKSSFGLIVTAIVPIIVVYIPFINSAFNLMAIDLLALFISVVTGVIPAVGYILVKKLINFK